MANSEIDHLLKMANDITANLSFREDADLHIADHINRFWAPRMRKLLVEYKETGGQDLTEVLLSAISKLKT